MLTNEDTRDNILKLIRNKRKFEKNHKKNKTKKFLTNRKQHDKISELPLRTTAKQHSSCEARGYDL